MSLIPDAGRGVRRFVMGWEIDLQWQHVLSERDRLRKDLEALADALRRYHDEHHVGAALWCDAAPCRLLFRRGPS